MSTLKQMVLIMAITTLINISLMSLMSTIRIYHEREGGIEKSIPRITVWHHEPCRVMTKGDPKGRIILSHPHMNDGYSFLLTIKYRISYYKKAPQSSQIH